MASNLQDFPFGIMDVVELLHLRVRRHQADSVYVDCPFCGDCRGKMNVNHAKNVWRCNYCGEYGGMLALYARLNHTTNSDAYREICDSLQTGETSWGYEERERNYFSAGGSSKEPGAEAQKETVSQSERASAREIHQTYALLLEMLSLVPKHTKHLQSEKRGLTEEQIREIGFKSTPPFYLCRSLTKRLLMQGCTVQGVPGFYQDASGNWTVNFNSITAGILIPAVGIDGLIQGLQILLDVPIRDKDAPSEKTGTKYLWLSSSTKHMGTTSGSPVHFVGNPFTRTLYVTEGLLKADIAHYLMNRSFLAIAGANNVAQLDTLFQLLAQNGTELIVEAHDMDKYSNKATAKGSSKIYQIARQCGLECKRLTWNPNYKGVDDWQLAVRKKEQERKEVEILNFKEQYLLGLCDMRHIENKTEEWHKLPEKTGSLQKHLGLSEAEYMVYLRDGTEQLKKLLDAQKGMRHFRFYHLDFGEEQRPISYAFKGLAELHKAGYEQPPAADYQMVYEGNVSCPLVWQDADFLQYIRKCYGNNIPEDFRERPLAPSDLVELYDQEKRRYYYVESAGFVPVRFSPFLARTKLISKKTDDNEK